MIFFSEGIDYPITDVFGGHSASDVIRATQDAITMAARSNVNYFTIDPRGLVGMTPEWMEMQGSGAPTNAGGLSLGTSGTNSPRTGITGAAGPMNAQSRADARAHAFSGQPAHARGGDGRNCRR